MYSHDIINQNLNLELHSKNVIERKNVSLYAKANRISCYNTVYLIYRGIINYFDLKMSLLISKVNKSGVLQQHALSCVTAAHFKVCYSNTPRRANKP
jgi:activator of HSP90 ATPase